MGQPALVSSRRSSAPRRVNPHRDLDAARSPSERRRVSFYFTIGTQNQDPRGMMLDGEASLVVSGSQAAVALVDFYFLMARTTWITRQTELDQYVPPYGDFIRWIARKIRLVL